MAAQRRRNSYLNQASQNARTKLTAMVARLGKDWTTLTFRADSAKLGPLKISHWNWLIIVMIAISLYFLPGQRLQTAAALGGWLIVTLTRAAYIMPKRRTALTKLYDLLQAKAFLPAGTATRPISPESHLTSVKWGKGLTPTTFTLATGAKCPSASSTILRPVLEATIEDVVENPLASEGGDWVFAWNPKARTVVSCVAVPGDHPGLMQKTIERRIIRALRDASAFNLTVAVAVQDNYSLVIEDWAEETKSDGETVPFPTSMTFRTGSRDLTDVGFRDTIERGFDRLIPCPGEWLYGWDVEGGSLRITRVAKSSLEARRKLHERKFADDVRSAVTKLGKDPIVAAVTGWAADDSDQPQTITVHFGTLQLGERRMRDRFEDSLDNSVQSRWPDLRLLFDWQLGGGATTLDIFGVDHKDQRAQRKAVEKKLRNVVESKFGKTRSPVDCDILEWQDSDGTTNAALPKIARVSFGAIDVNKAETRDDFQEHWDSLVVENDWHYHWDSAEGTVTITAVEKLATAIAFPEVGTPEFEEIVEHFRAGRIYIGPQKGGGVFYWDLNKVAHGLVGGRTGAGKLLDLKTRMVTPGGWRSIGELKVGDKVFDENGQPCCVTGVFDEPVSDNCFEVVFSDGSTVVADDEHLWWTEDRAARRSRSGHRSFDESRERRPWLTPDAIARLRTEASRARPDATISIPEVAALADVDSSSQALFKLARSIGAARERRHVMRSYTYAEQKVLQRKLVRVYPASEACDWLVSRVRSPRRSALMSTHADALLALCAQYRGHETITAEDFARGLGMKAKPVGQWLSQGSNLAYTLEEREVTLDVPAKTVQRLGPVVVLYPRSALLRLVADYGSDPMWDQQHLSAVGQVRTTNEIRHSIRTESGHLNHSIPVTKPLQFPRTELPIAAYTFGAWLGDGTSSGGEITSMDPEVIDRIRSDGYTVIERMLSRARIAVGYKARTYGIRGIHGELTRLGVRKCSKGDGQTKRIPEIYLRASEEQRRQLLAGLLDTDGTAAPGGPVQFDNTNEALADGVLELARGLGYRATMTSRPAMLNGIQHGTVYRVAFTTADKVFGLNRKQRLHAERMVAVNAERHSHRYIVDVRKVAPVPMRCISVDSPTRQFLAGEAMIPTHNSVALDIALFLTLWCRDTADIIVCDPKRTDFTWTPEFPNVVRFAAGVVEIVEAIQFVHDEMERRQSLLNRRGVRNLGYLRTLYEAHPEFEAEDGPAPKRLILFFDELSNFSGQSANEDIEALKTVARTQLEGLGQLARALEINMIVAAQKPEAKYVSTQLKEMMEFRLCVGPVNEYTSKQILETNHGTRFPESGTPKGRAWATTSEIGFKVVQIPYLPNATEPCPWDPSITLTGSRERLRTQLAAAGYGTRTRTNKDGGTDAFWVPVEGDPDRQTGDEATVVGAEITPEGAAIAQALTATTPQGQQTRSLRIVKQPEQQPDSAPGAIVDLDAEPHVGEDDPWAV